MMPALPHNQSLAKLLANIITAIDHMRQSRKGSRAQDIIKYICSVRSDLPRAAVQRQVLTALKRAKRHGILCEIDGRYNLLPKNDDCLGVTNQQLGLLDLGCRKRKQDARKRKKSGRSCECKPKGKKRKSSKRRRRSRSRKKRGCGSMRSASKKRRKSRKRRRGNKKRSKYDCGMGKERKSKRRRSRSKRRGKRSCSCPTKSGDGRDVKAENKDKGTKCAMNFYD